MNQETGVFLIPRKEKWHEITQLSQVDTALAFKWCAGQALGFPNVFPSLPTGETTFLQPLNISPHRVLETRPIGHEGNQYFWNADFSDIPPVKGVNYVLTLPFLGEVLPDSVSELHQIYYFQDLKGYIRVGSTLFWKKENKKYASSYQDNGMYSRYGTGMRGGIPLTPPISIAQGLEQEDGALERFAKIEKGLTTMAETVMASTLHVLVENKTRSQGFWDEMFFG